MKTSTALKTARKRSVMGYWNKNGYEHQEIMWPQANYFLRRTRVKKRDFWRSKNNSSTGRHGGPEKERRRGFGSIVDYAFHQNFCKKYGSCFT
ncbi:hypothetical protein HPP92_007145 [Vanilla planifolia]|uniref:Uncharacterized protein n=1 Tax=Vanilla planifolia TaxID=51239 RepID=A0A835V9C9_VANPL|nr:hypothetical protein HPP92_007384 [Vanilla planifolia]KAG0490282.1 hypothetical protein HPP92_007145 [Vanilla planifolia]